MEMDEAATSSTSLRAGTLHTPQDPKQLPARQYQPRTSSFPTSLTFKTALSFDIFRKNKNQSPKAPTKASDRPKPEVDSKPEPNTAPNAEEEEPYEVAPGIWSNEATAKVFGYLDVPYSEQAKGKKHRKEKRSESAGPSLYCRKNRAPSPVKNSVQVPNLARPEHDRLESSSWRTYRGRTDESVRKGQEGKAEAGGAGGEVGKQTTRGRVRDTSTHRGMRTVGKDDTLVARGANPRTGFVSPYATSESAESGFMTRGRREETAGWREKKTRNGNRMERSASGRWMQDSQGWSLIGSQAMTPVAQSVRPGVDRRRSSVPIAELQDRFVVNMPSAKEPAPLQLSREHIDAYHRSVERACRDAGGIQALVDPETFPTPRTMTPEGPSTPPRRLEKIRRKEVGSAMSQRKGSTDTVIIHGQARASSMPTPRKEQQRQLRARVVSPAHTVLDVSKQAGGHNNEFHYEGDPFLGVRQDARSYQTNATPFPSYQTRHIKDAPSLQTKRIANHEYHLQSRENTDTAACARQPPSQTLRQCLPPVNLVHPRQASIPRPKPFNQDLKQIQNIPAPTTITTAITTPITTTTTPPHRCIPPLDGTDSVPQANHLQGHFPQRRIPKVRFQPMPPAAFATGSDLRTGRQQQEIVESSKQERPGMPLSLVAGHSQGPRTQSNRKASTCDSGSRPLPCPYPWQTVDEANRKPEVRMRGGERSMTGLLAGGREREPFRPILGNGHGDIRTGGRRTGERAVVITGGGTEAVMSKTQATTTRRSIEHANIADINASFATEKQARTSKPQPSGPSADDIRFGESADSCLSPATTSTTSTYPDPQTNTTRFPNTTAPIPPPTLLTTLHALRLAAHHLEQTLHFSFTHLATDAFLSLLHMNQHVLSTLHPSSTTLRVLTLTKGLEQQVGLEEWVKAVRDVLLAALYLLVLGAVLGVVGRVLACVCRCLAGVWAFGRVWVGVWRWVFGV